MEFQGEGLPLSPSGIDAATAALDVGPETLWAVIRVETRGWGFLADRRPQILFERHVFHRLTGGRFKATAPTISSRKPGGISGGAENTSG
jgi:hypothetical protein